MQNNLGAGIQREPENETQGGTTERILGEGKITWKTSAVLASDGLKLKR